MDKRILASLIVIVLSLPLFSGCVEDSSRRNEKPMVEITYPLHGGTVAGLVMISGTASDPDGDDTLVRVEVQIGDNTWGVADGTMGWSYDWRTYQLEDGMYSIQVRAWDGQEYSDVDELMLVVDNPETVESDAHRWAVFVAAANFPEDNEDKLGNGGLYLAEEIATYLIEECQYATSNIFLLFDDGWIRGDNGYGERIETLQERIHDYNIMYGGATKQNVRATLEYVIEQSNRYADSEVFIWMFNHGCGEENNTLTGGKIFESSELFLWDDTITDRELGDLLFPLQSTETCIIVDACFSGGFADKTIYNFPTVFLLKSGIPRSGRVVISGTSKYRLGFTSTTQGPLFSLLWFEGLKTGAADGFRMGLGGSGRPTRFPFFKDGKVSVEEAFYYAKYRLKTDDAFEEFSAMEPQMNDQYPKKGLLRSIGQLFLG